ncbi:MAG: Dyp-type peroxidase [Pseudonocardiales bacterium]|nr:Dyp-type peroxidase [Pseudonocardiales bacterium]
MSAPTPNPDRRAFLRAGGLTGGGLIAGGLIGGFVGQRAADSTSADKAADTATTAATNHPTAFYGTRQAGVTGRAPAQLRFLALDLTALGSGTGADAPPAARADLEQMLRRLTDAAARLMAGEWITEQIGAPAGLTPSALTVTVAVGARAVQAAGAAVPPALTPLPAFAGESLDPARSDGDLGLQICGDDPFVVASAAQALTVIAAPWARVRWTQTGFVPGPAATIATASTTPRNLMGQLDGTDNPTGSRLELAVWVNDPQTPWMSDGSYLVCRRIRMLLPDWRALSVAERSQVIGRAVDTGAPLTGGGEHATPNFSALQSDGRPVIAADAHLRLTHPANNAGATMLRRAYSYDDGMRADGTPEAGLFFQCFQTDPQAVFVPIQRALVASDALSRFIRHESSALFAVLPAVAEGHWLGEAMFR